MPNIQQVAALTHKELDNSFRCALWRYGVLNANICPHNSDIEERSPAPCPVREIPQNTREQFWKFDST